MMYSPETGANKVNMNRKYKENMTDQNNIRRADQAGDGSYHVSGFPIL